jgi:uncharacterized damage-inducible protein DinB
MLTIDDYARQPREQRMQRLARTADELAAAIEGQDDAVLSRRPDAKNWAAKEVICHLRDAEEVFATRIEQILAMDAEPAIIMTDPDREAEDRQYLRHDAGQALAAFRRRRLETLVTFGKLAPRDWDKAGLHPVAGRLPIDAFLSVIAWHDDNHLAQLARALRCSAAIRKS